MTMRMMARWTVPVERGNECVRDGSLAKTMQALIKDWSPEAVYFWAENGERGGMMALDMKDAARIPKIAEPLFLNHDALVDFVPVMNQD